jgi:hypothetical protein
VCNKFTRVTDFNEPASGDAYLIVAGCPVKTNSHALKICDMAFDMVTQTGANPTNFSEFANT